MKIDKKINSQIANWKFDRNVVNNFENHINKSVPFYKISHDLTLKLSEFFVKDKSLVYDLGCSTGILLKEISKKHSKKQLKLVGFDESKDMIKKAKKPKIKNLTFIQSNINNKKFKKADMFISLYTLQFVKPEFRQKIFNNIYKSLNWGGALILFEKIRGNDARFQDILTFLYFDFKKKSGLKDLEILNKEMSLRSVLEPYTIEANLQFMKRAGFKDIMPICQYLNFKGFLAIK